ncbi:unnamed protein product [Colias eurytheme]|nr:unnamed protein product [Colias eurytheme]
MHDALVHCDNVKRRDGAGAVTCVGSSQCESSMRVPTAQPQNCRRSFCAGDRTQPQRKASRGEVPAAQLFTHTCPARVFFALADRNSLRDRRCRWQTSCDMSATVRALRTQQLASHLSPTARPESPLLHTDSEERCLHSRNDRKMIEQR